MHYKVPIQKLLNRIILCTALFCLTPGTLIAAEPEPPILRITGNLIDEIQELDQETDANKVIDAYYSRLDTDTKNEAYALRDDLAALVPDYEVAFNSADTAELNNVVSDFALVWAKIRTLHAREFTPAARRQLRHTYERLFPLLAPAPRDITD